MRSIIPNEPFEVFEKLDGSLGILFNYRGEWLLATKGSFTSDQALKGMEMLRKYEYERLDPGYTYLFEIIYDENRIVCQYEYEDLVLLSVIDNEDGSEVPIHHGETLISANRIRNLCNNLGFRLVQKYDGVNDYKELKSLIANDREGYVIRFKSGFRMKIKGEEYMRLHRILTGFSNVDIWEYLKDGKDFNEFLDRVPDEFDSWVRETVRDLVVRYENIERDYKSIFGEIFDPNGSKREFAEKAKPYRHSSLLFSMHDGKDYSKYIWKIIRPEYQKPFWKTDL